MAQKCDIKKLKLEKNNTRNKKMIIILKKETEKKDIDIILNKIKEHNLEPLYLPGTEKIVIGAIGDERVLATLNLDALPFVEKIMPVLTPYKLVSRDFKQEDTIINVKGVNIGKEFVVMGGPCAVENEQQLMITAKEVKKAGAQILRGGAYKPRTSPYAFQGLKEAGLKLLKKVGDELNMPIITEVVSPETVDVVAEYADILQVGTRNMQNFDLLKRLGKINKPVLLKRGMSATIEEFLMAAEYIMSEGNHQVILCERGIRTFETATRNTLDLGIVPLLKQKTHLPVIVDPSHATGIRSLVAPMAKASLVAGADGLIIEVHYNPETAKSDGMQSLYPNQFESLMKDLRVLAKVSGKEMR